MTKSSKNILLFGWHFYPQTGGVETILLNQARELISRGYQVSILTSPIDEKTSQDEILFGIKIYRRDYVNPKIKYPYKYIKSDLLKIIKNDSPSVFHFHNGSYPSGSLDKNSGVSNVISIFNTISKFNILKIEHAHNAQLKDNQITKPLRDLPWDVLICVSQFVKKEWEKLGTNAKHKIVIFNGINIIPFLNAKPNQFILSLKKKNPKSIIFFNPARLVSLTTGDLNKQKNIELVFKALGILKKRGIENFVFVSIFNQPNDPKLLSLASQKISKILHAKKINKKVKLIPVINPDKIPGFYSGSDIICVPAFYETFGLMYLEAMLSGKVVISANQGGPTEFISSGKNGFFVDPTNETKLADLLETIINNKSLRKKIGLNAQKTASKFTVENMVDQIEQVYKSYKLK